MKNQLLCTFSDKRYIINTIRNILDVYHVNNDKIFIYDIKTRPMEVMCSYNISNTMNQEFMDYTITVHRKKSTNTFYTINALNQLIMEVNNNILDIEYSINWNNYRDMLILINDTILRKEHINFREVFLIKNTENKNE